MCACLSACESVCVPACERVCTPGSMFVYMSTCECVCMSVRWFVCPLAGGMCVCVLFFVPVRRVCMSVSLFGCPCLCL